MSRKPGAIPAASAQALFKGEFRGDLKDSDALHWGGGAVTVTATTVALLGRLAPGLDYKLYLSPRYVETETDIQRLKPSMLRVADVKTFENFVVTLRAGVDPDKYAAVIVWCDTFGEIITAARYQ